MPRGGLVPFFPRLRGFIMPAIYCADCYCDSCADKLREVIRSDRAIAGEPPIDESDERSYDSDEFPKYMSEDEESDTPEHCASQADCLEAETLPSGHKIGKMLSHSLTGEGVKYVEEYIAEGGEVAEFWREQFSSAGYDFNLTDIAERCPDFGEFWQAYCDALCFTAHDDSEQGDSLFAGNPGDDFADVDDWKQVVAKLLPDDELQDLRADCAAFFIDHRALFNGQFGRAGADFHYSRNGHGTGFFDRDCYADHEEELQQFAKEYGSCELMGKLVDGEPTAVFVCH